jgi:hypothetical protein
LLAVFFFNSLSADAGGLESHHRENGKHIFSCQSLDGFLASNQSRSKFPSAFNEMPAISGSLQKKRFAQPRVVQDHGMHTGVPKSEPSWHGTSIAIIHDLI